VVKRYQQYFAHATLPRMAHVELTQDR